MIGADNTGSFSGKGKLACWKVFNRADEDVITALANLGTTEHPDEDTIKGVEKFVCHLYQPNTSICKVNELRWSLFKNKQAKSERLPPTHGALREAILRAHYYPITRKLYMVERQRRVAACDDDNSTTVCLIISLSVFHFLYRQDSSICTTLNFGIDWTSAVSLNEPRPKSV